MGPSVSTWRRIRCPFSARVDERDELALVVRASRVLAERLGPLAPQIIGTVYRRELDAAHGLSAGLDDDVHERVRALERDVATRRLDHEAAPRDIPQRDRQALDGCR